MAKSRAVRMLRWILLSGNLQKTEKTKKKQMDFKRFKGVFISLD